MKLEQLSYVIEIANTGSFSQAAKNLYIAQPSLSRSIKQLEEEIGYPLFIRKSNGVIPTEEGLELIGRARLIYRECQELSHIFSRQDKPRRLQLRVAFLDCHAAMFLPELYQEYSGMPINMAMIECANLQDVIQMLLICRVDYAIIGTLSLNIEATKATLRNEDIEYHAFSKSEIYAAVGPKSELYHRDAAIRLEQLYPHVIVSYATIDGNSRHNSAVALGIENRTRGDIRTNSLDLFNAFVQNTPAVGLRAAPPRLRRLSSEGKNIKLLPLQDSPVWLEYAWIKLRRFPLNDFAWDTLERQIKAFEE